MVSSIGGPSVLLLEASDVPDVPPPQAATSCTAQQQSGEGAVAGTGPHEKLPGTWTELRALPDRESELSLKRPGWYVKRCAVTLRHQAAIGSYILSVLVTLRIALITHGVGH